MERKGVRRVDVRLEAYRTFYEVAKQGNMTRAAEALHVSQPAVSQAIRQLEQQLGGALFMRNARGMMLTKEGEALLRYVEQALRMIAEGENRFLEMHELLQGEIRIGASDTLCRHYLLRALERFHGAYPQVNVQVTNRTTRETLELLREARVDVAFLNLPIEEDPHLEMEPVREVHDVFVAGPAYREAANKDWTLGAVAGLPLVLLERASNSRCRLDDWALAQGVALHPSIELGSTDLCTAFARVGLGITCVVREFVQAELRRGELVELPVQPSPPPRYIGMATLRDVPLSFAAKTFVRMLREMDGESEPA